MNNANPDQWALSCPVTLMQPDAALWSSADFSEGNPSKWLSVENHENSIPAFLNIPYAVHISSSFALGARVVYWKEREELSLPLRDIKIGVVQ